MRKLGMTICVLCAIIMFTGCSGEDIYGSWQYDGLNVQYTFNEDFTMLIEVVGGKTYNGTFEFDQDNKKLLIVSIPEYGHSVTGEYEIKDKQLIITSPDSGSVISMTRIKK